VHLGVRIQSHEVSAAGQKFMVAHQFTAFSPQLTLLRNWPAALRK
jgi:hypothetical protein